MYMHTRIYVYVYTHMRICIVYTHMRICIHAYPSQSVHVYLYMYMYTRRYVYEYTHTRCHPEPPPPPFPKLQLLESTCLVGCANIARDILV
jgi:hypothetical protein